MASPYYNKPISEWEAITKELVEKHPLYKEIVNVVLKSWDDIFNSKIGSFYIGKEIFPSPQIMSFFLHELVAHYLSLKYPTTYKVGVQKNEKDVHNIQDAKMGIEIKASSHPSQIFANRSYAQPSSDSEIKDKNGYYIAINFEKFTSPTKRPQILKIRFGYLEHVDWIAQKAATGQQARLSPVADKHKLITIYPSKNLDEISSQDTDS